jgi:hypothetical protein
LSLEVVPHTTLHGVSRTKKGGPAGLPAGRTRSERHGVELFARRVARLFGESAADAEAQVIVAATVTQDTNDLRQQGYAPGSAAASYSSRTSMIAPTRRR